MKRIFVLLIITIGCISQQPPSFEECSPQDTELTVGRGETIEFSCRALDPDTEELLYTWYQNGEKVADTSHYDFTTTPGEYTIMIEVSDGKATIFFQWDVTVLDSPDYEKVQLRLESIRGLKFLEPVNVIVIDRNQLRETFMNDLQEELNTILMEQKLYVALHVMDSEVNLYQLYVDLFTVQVASFYDTEDHTFYEVVDPDEPIVYREFVAAHELTHALQDQYHYLDAQCENDDAQLAFLCVIEGDAMYHQYEYLDELTPYEKENLLSYIRTLNIPRINAFLEGFISLRYDLGFAFVSQMYILGVDQLYEKLPCSTEQVMHPEKYLAYELPANVAVPSVSGWEKRFENVLGEAFLKTILNEHIDAVTATQAAEGWGGDAYGYYERGEEYLFVLNTSWDTELDATEFFEAYLAFTLSWANQDVKQISENLYQTPTGFLALKLNGRQVVIAESPSLEAVSAALSLILTHSSHESQAFPAKWFSLQLQAHFMI